MKKAVAHLIPFMEEEKAASMAQLEHQGGDTSLLVLYDIARNFRKG